MKVCFGCEHLQFGFSSDRDRCDYVCNMNGTETNLFCTHGMSQTRMTKKLKSLVCWRIKIVKNQDSKEEK